MTNNPLIEKYNELYKPKPPGPRLIREDFLPERDVLKNYRVMKVYNENDAGFVFVPQYKFLGLFWLCLDAHRTFYSFETAVDYINFVDNKNINRKRKPEYLEVTEEDLKNSSSKYEKESLW